MRYEVVGAVLAFSVVAFGITTTGIIDPSLMGLALAYSLELTNFLKQALDYSH